MVMLTKGGAFLSTKNAVEGSLVKFLNEGEWVENTKFLDNAGRPVNQFNIQVDYRGEKMQVKVTAASRDELASAWGYETKNWIGKIATVSLVPTPTGKKSIWLRPAKEQEKQKTETLGKTLNPEDISWKD